jgi:putative transcriptional regulator
MNSMSDSLAPSLLLSMPQLQDPNFARTVVLLCEHAPDGAFGLVLNRPTDVAAATAVRLEPPVVAGNGLKLWIGGPVEPQRGWIIVDREPRGGIRARLSTACIFRVRRWYCGVCSRPTRSRARVLAGYAGWGPGCSMTSSPSRRG